MLASRIMTVGAGLAILFLVVLPTAESLAGQQLYQGAWVAESFGNDKVGVGTEASLYFEALAIPQGQNCHPMRRYAPLPRHPSRQRPRGRPGTHSVRAADRSQRVRNPARRRAERPQRAALLALGPHPAIRNPRFIGTWHSSPRAEQRPTNPATPSPHSAV